MAATGEGVASAETSRALNVPIIGLINFVGNAASLMGFIAGIMAGADLETGTGGVIGWPPAGRANSGEIVALTEVKAGKLWRGAMLVAGLAGVVRVALAVGCELDAVFSWACALAERTNGTAKTAGNSKASRGLDADMAEKLGRNGSRTTVGSEAFNEQRQSRLPRSGESGSVSQFRRHVSAGQAQLSNLWT